MRSELDLDRIRVAGQLQALRHARHVRVDGNRRLFEPGPEHDVGGFPSDSWERDEIVHAIRHLAAEALDQRLTQPDQRFRLVLEETGRSDLILENAEVRFAHAAAFCTCGRDAV
jgi:hypothetical protein